MFRFRKFQVYKDARKFRKEFKQLTKDKFPKEENFALKSQLWRALDSILLNIAEGTDKYSDTDFSRYLNNALGSLNEVVACLDCAIDDKYINSLEYQKFICQSEHIAQQLLKLSSKVRNSGKSKK